MDVSLDSLEHKLDQLIDLCSRLRTENQSLRNRVADLETDNSALANKIDVTRSRLEALMERLPAE